MKRFRSRRATGGLKVQEITGDHFSFMQVSHVMDDVMRKSNDVFYDRALSMDFHTNLQQLVTRKITACWPSELRMANSECILVLFV